ncbi:MAG: putative oxidoreductase UxuB [Elusimicrobia bacterium]|nr:putative oxidoreductase UxuB [Elusimicrobiota bacterium]
MTQSLEATRVTKSIDERFNLKGKVGVVIGGAGYLCSELAKAMMESGMELAVVDIRPSSLDKTKYPLTDFVCDVTKRTELEIVHEKIIKKYGRVDALLNGAGVNAPTPFLEITEEEIHRIFDSHVTATILACQIFGRSMLERKQGSIVNFASASSGPPLSKAFVYSVAKAGVANITQNLAREWALSNVRVNALRPGFFPTEWSMKNFIDPSRQEKILGHTPMGRYGKPEELAGAVLWLLSDAASFVTGSIVAVDGGFTAMTI